MPHWTVRCTGGQALRFANIFGRSALQGVWPYLLALIAALLLLMLFPDTTLFLACWAGVIR